MAANKNTYKQVTAIVNSKIEEIASWLRKRKSKGVQLQYDKELVRSIIAFKKDPSKFKKVQSPKIPDGSPIGMD